MIATRAFAGRRSVLVSFAMREETVRVARRTGRVASKRIRGIEEELSWSVWVVNPARNTNAFSWLKITARFQTLDILIFQRELKNAGEKLAAHTEA
jgi:hypothetical protein